MDNNEVCENFQEAVSKALIRHKSILDILSKFHETNARVNRAVVKSVTQCGCLQIRAQKQEIPEDASFRELQQYMESHLKGFLCPSCQETIEKEIGKNIFYIAALCNSLDLDLQKIIKNECAQANTLGIFNLR